MKLFLTSAGLQPEITESFLKLLGKKPEETKVCFIPTASYEHHPEGDAWYVKADKQRLSELGFKIITEVDLRKENKKSLDNKLKDFDVIFVGGGNTFYLLKYVRESGFNEALKHFLKRRGVYIGASAGSIVVGPDILTAKWGPYGDENTVELKNLSGIGLVDFIVVPHYTIDQKQTIEGNVIKEKISSPIIAITDKQAVLVENGRMEFVGPGEFKEFK
jgi:dipeptidase E